jgi:hypothetical protein
MLALVVSQTVVDASSSSAQAAGSISGMVTDEAGTPVAATIRVSGDANWTFETVAGAGGRFAIVRVPPGRVQVAVTAPGFAAETIAIVLSADERSELPPIRLRLAFDAVAVDVTASQVELAEQQIKEQEQQRVLGVIPNFYVSYLPNAAPLNAAQKFKLSWKATIDPMQFVGVAAIAGIEQARGQFPGFGDGWDGYAKRYAAAYATESTQRLFSRVIMPSLFRQDPRYFYKGEGSVRSRIGYALSRAVIRKGDNGHWQPNYSSVLGSFAGAVVSNFYYPEEDRRGAGLMLQNVGFSLTAAAVGNLAQEFLFDKFTRRARHNRQPQPSQSP